MIFRTKHFGSFDLAELTDELLPVGRFTVHPTVLIEEDGTRKLLVDDWTLSHTETGTSLGLFDKKDNAVLAAHSLECLHWPNDLFSLAGNKAFRRATIAIVEYHYGDSTAKEK